MPFALKNLSTALREERSRFIVEMKTRIGKCEHPFCPNGNLCSNPLALAAHEYWVSGNDLRGVDSEEVWRLILLHPANVVNLHNTPCHIVNKPSLAMCLNIVAGRPDSFYNLYGFMDAKDAIWDFKYNMKKLHQQGLIKVLPKNILS